MMNYNTMTDEELGNRMDKLGEILETICPCDDAWDEAYKEYFRLEAIRSERYREANQKSFDAFYEAHIKGKTWEEIDPEDWSWYSDWHKDMYGYRPRSI